MVVYICQCFPLNSSHLLLTHCAHKSVLYVCVSIPALKIGLSVHFPRFHKYALISWLKAQHSENEDHGIWSHHFMGNRWGNSGNGVRLFGGSKITADGDCSHEIKRRLLLGRKVMTNLDSISKAETLLCQQRSI